MCIDDGVQSTREAPSEATADVKSRSGSKGAKKLTADSDGPGQRSQRSSKPHAPHEADQKSDTSPVQDGITDDDAISDSKSSAIKQQKKTERNKKQVVPTAEVPIATDSVGTFKGVDDENSLFLPPSPTPLVKRRGPPARKAGSVAPPAESIPAAADIQQANTSIAATDQSIVIRDGDGSGADDDSVRSSTQICRYWGKGQCRYV